MIDDDLLRERAEAYASVAETTPRGTQRCLEVTENGKSWSFPESEVALVLPYAKVMLLPKGARWGDWPCLGLLCHALSTLPVLCWSQITNSGYSSSPAHQHFLLLRECRLALRVSGKLALISENLEQKSPELVPWSAGRLTSGSSLANLDPLQQQGGS